MTDSETTHLLRAVAGQVDVNEGKPLLDVDTAGRCQCMQRRTTQRCGAGGASANDMVPGLKLSYVYEKNRGSLCTHKFFDDWNDQIRWGREEYKFVQYAFLNEFL